MRNVFYLCGMVHCLALCRLKTKLSHSKNCKAGTRHDTFPTKCVFSWPTKLLFLATKDTEASVGDLQVP